MSEIMESMKYEAPVLPTGTSAFRAAGREKKGGSMKEEGRMRLRRGGESRGTGGEVDLLFSYFCLHPSDFLFLPVSVSRYFWRRLLGLSGMVISMKSSANNLSNERLKFPVREL